MKTNEGHEPQFPIYHSVRDAENAYGDIELIGSEVRVSESCAPSISRTPTLEDVYATLRAENPNIVGIVCTRTYDSYWVPGAEGCSENWSAFR